MTKAEKQILFPIAGMMAGATLGAAFGCIRAVINVATLPIAPVLYPTVGALSCAALPIDISVPTRVAATVGGFAWGCACVPLAPLFALTGPIEALGWTGLGAGLGAYVGQKESEK